MCWQAYLGRLVDPDDGSVVIILAALLLLPLTAHAGDLSGRVVAISDGDTLTVLDQANQLLADAHGPGQVSADFLLD